MIRVGIIGWNEKVKTLAIAIHSKIKNTELLGWATSDKEGIAFAKELGLKHVFRSPEQLYEIHQLDAIIIFGSSQDHEELVKDSLKSGVSVMVDFPLAHNVDEAIKLKQIIEHFPSLKTAIIFPRRYDTQLLELKRMVDEGRLGHISHIRISNVKIDDPYVSDKGIFMNQMIEDVDTLHWLLGDRVASAVAIGSATESNKISGIENINQASAQGYLSEGTTFELFAKNNASASILQIELWGAEGTLKYSSADNATLNWTDKSNAMTSLVAHEKDDYQKIFEDFIYRVSHGEKILMDLDDAVNATKVAVALSKSYLLKTPATITY